MKALRLVIAAAALIVTIPAAAQSQKNPLAHREAQLPAILSWLQTQGVRLTFLGEEGGLRGYIGESANGKMQTFYVTPDGNHVVAGILFQTGGTNVTGVQIGEMRARFDSASKEIESATVGGGSADADSSKVEASGGMDAAGKNDSASSAISPAPVPAPAMSETASTPASSEKPEEPEAAAADPAATEKVGDKAERADISIPPPSGPIAGAEGKPAEMWISKLDRNEFLQAAEKAPFFEVGAIHAKPVLWMVADPQCPYCHRTWDTIRSLVYAKKLRVRIILIAGLQGSEPKAREILARPVPARAWLDTNAGRGIELTTDQTSKEWVAAGQFLSRNMDFAKRFGIDRTPFLAYVGEDGKFYSALGLPSDLTAFLSASGAL